ncbi:Phosphopantetheine adenylyltransferase [Drechslerella dactyloides]|uniref:Phosphopantetheine adenylyltransferase n=1 Tax=Drechslerella dactyloides TaxID=74499 RepID=A0AAD6IQU5_DREDA|nr:Phosphopantetheine adenylyltransferase [Drechslerella dactyloides]
MATRNLLFLRSLPTSNTELHAAITQAVLFSSSSITSIKHLDIAVTLPFTSSEATGSNGASSISRRRSFAQVSAIVNRIYSLTEGINEELDVNVILLHEDYNACGGVIRHWSDLRRASEVGQWGNILSTEDVDDLFGPNCKNAVVLQLEPDSVHERWWEASSDGSELPSREEHTISCVGGTFDYLHAGHKLLLTMTAYMIFSHASSPRLIVGLTGAELLKNKKHRQYVTSWETRCDATVDFLRMIVGDTTTTTASSSQPNDTEMDVDTSSDLPTSSRILRLQLTSPAGTPIALEVHEIQDVFGPTITMEDVTCLVVSEESKGGGQAVNDKRREKGWSELEVFTVGLVGGDGSVEGKLSSTEMRRRRAERGNILKGFVS